MKNGETGNAIQKRFYSMSPYSREDRLNGLWSGGYHEAHVYSVDWAEGAVSGLYITTEAVFFGTRSMLARFDEIGTHYLSLMVLGPAGTVVSLKAGNPPVCIRSLPAGFRILC